MNTENDDTTTKCVVCWKIKSDKVQLGNAPSEEEIQQKLTIDILQTVYPQTKLVLSDISNICGKCEARLNKAFDFKSFCLDIDDYLKNFLNAENKIDMNEVYFHVYEISCENDSTKQELCRLCLESIEDIAFVTIEDQQLKVMLKICLPELDPTLTDTFVVCSICMRHLKKQYGMIKDLAKVEGSVSMNKKYMDPDRIYRNIDNKPKIKRGRGKVKNDPDEQSGKPNKCSQCEYTSKERKSLQLHILLTHLDVNSVITEKISNGSKTYVCKECPFESFRDYIMWSHVLSHEDVFEPVPKRPKYEFKTRNKVVLAKQKVAARNSKIRWKQNPLVYRCTLCSFKEYKNPSHHYQRHIIRNARILKCETCVFKTNHQKQLQLHNKTHKGKKTPKRVPNYLKCVFCEFETEKVKTFSQHCKSCPKNTPREKFYVRIKSCRPLVTRSD